MGHLKTLSVKMILQLPVLFLILTLIGDLRWTSALLAALVFTVLAYVLGDLFVLPSTGNILAAAMDSALFFGLLYFLFREVGMASILVGAVGVFIVEAFIYHPYLDRLVTIDSSGPPLGDRDQEYSNKG